MQISMAKMNKHDVVSQRVSGCAIPSRHGPGSKFFTPRMSRVAWFSYWFHSEDNPFVFPSGGWTSFGDCS